MAMLLTSFDWSAGIVLTATVIQDGMEIKGHTVTCWATWAGLLHSGILFMLKGVFSTEGWQVLSW